MLAQGLPVKKEKSYSSNNNVQDEVRLMEQNQTNNKTNGYSVNTQNYTYSDPPSDGGSAPAPGYTPSESQMSHQQTPYPAATQYSPYLETAPNSSESAYAQQENQNYAGYSAPTTDSVEAPLIAALAAQASQATPSPWPHRNSIQANTAPTQAWQHWTSTITGNLEPQECYSASALMQLGGRDMNNGDATQLNTSMGEVQNGVVGGQGHLGGQVSGAIPGAIWPLNIFDIGANGATG